MQLPLKRGTYTISSGYRTPDRPDHRGIDFAAPTGTPIYAPFDARVIQGSDRAPGSVDGFHNWVWLEGYDDNPYDFIVGHMKHSSILVKAGDTVRAGQKIAEVASEGQSSGPHAHCELWESPGRIGGRDIDPTRFWGDDAPSPDGTAPAQTASSTQVKNYLTVEPDQYAITHSNRYTPGRNANIEYITRHHTGGKTDAAGVNNTWRDRPASAHYLVDPTGHISQHVHDRDTAWSNADAASNARSISIEHSNDGGPDWSISEATIREGARWAAALCLYYGLGRPVFGKNIRDHREFSGTSCPYHLASGGKYHQQWMDEAQAFYDHLEAQKNATQTTPPQDAGGSSVALTPAYFTDFIKGYFGPQIDALQEVWTQLRGPGGNGWAQLGRTADGRNLTLVDGVAALRRDVAEVHKQITLLRNELKEARR